MSSVPATLSAVTAPPPPPQRPRMIMVATGFASVASVMLFAGLFGIYLNYRSAAVAQDLNWIPADVTIPLTQPNMLFVTLLMSSVTVQWAVKAIRNDDRPGSYLALGITLLLGFAFINQMAYLYTVMGLDMDLGAPSILIYAISGAHLAMLIAAMVFVALMAVRALGGSFTSRQYDGLAAAALYWHVTVFLFSFLWLIIYVTK